MSNTIIVTRHKGSIDYLKEEGWIKEGDPTIEHATLEEVRGKDVIGMLPYHMAAEANTVTVLDLDYPVELRGTELTLQQVRQYATNVSIYTVTKVVSKVV